MPQAAVSTAHEDFAPQLNPFEAAFIRTVLEHRGLHQRPTLAEFAAALDVFRRYDEQRRDNPPDFAVRGPVLDADSNASLRAKVFLLFGATKPSAAQWQKAHAALFGPLLCESCDS